MPGFHSKIHLGLLAPWTKTWRYSMTHSSFSEKGEVIFIILSCAGIDRLTAPHLVQGRGNCHTTWSKEFFSVWQPSLWRYSKLCLQNH